MIHPNAPGRVRGLVVELKSMRNFQFDTHQKPTRKSAPEASLEQFWEPGGQDHIFGESGWVRNFDREMQTQK